MSVTYISELLTREEFYAKAFQKGKSKAYEKLTRTTINNLDTFCLDKYARQTDHNSDHNLRSSLFNPLLS